MEAHVLSVKLDNQITTLVFHELFNRLPGVVV